MSKRTGHTDTIAPRTAEATVWPASSAQNRLWLLESLTADRSLYSVPALLRLAGPLQAEPLREAFSACLARHEALRTGLIRHNGELFGVTLPEEEVRPRWEQVDLSGVDSDRIEADLTAQVEHLFTQPFDLTRPPLLTVMLYRLGPDTHVLAVAAHHSVCDGASLALVLEEAFADYDRIIQGQPPRRDTPEVGFPDWVEWRHARAAEEREADVAYWRRALTGVTRLALPADHPQPRMADHVGDVVRAELPATDLARVREWAAAEEISTAAVLLAAFTALLHRYTDQNDICVGVAATDRSHPAADHLVGMLVDTLPVRTDMHDAPTFRELCARVQHALRDAVSHAALPFEEILDAAVAAGAAGASRAPDSMPLVQVFFSHQRSSGWPTADELTVTVLPIPFPTSRFDLSLYVDEYPDRAELAFEYPTRLFDRDTIERCARHFQTLLTATLADPDRPIGLLSPLTAADHTELDRLGTGPTIDPGPDFLARLVAQHSETSPTAPAVTCEDRSLTYEALERATAALADRLRPVGAAPEVLVLVAVPRSVELVVALLAVLRTGAGFVPLDPAHPPARLRQISADSGARLLVTTRDSPIDLGEADHVTVYVDQDSELAAEPSPGEASAQIHHPDPDSLAYVLYTSGSLGEPKGVMVEHRALHNLLVAMDGVTSIGSEHTWLAVTSVSFDISLVELLWPLTRGAHVVISTGRATGDGTARAVTPGRQPTVPDLSLFYFGHSDPDEPQEPGYAALLAGAELADRLGLHAVWTPERHFDLFGAQYPAPAVLGAAIAARTTRLRIRAGSVVLPLHDPLRLLEEWAVVDVLSGGRVDVSLASGWHADDFVFAPEAYAGRREDFATRVRELAAGWRGAPMRRVNGAGETIEVRPLPRPLQPEPPLWITSAGSPQTFRLAGELGANLLTHLLGQDIPELGGKIAEYRQALAEHGHDPAGRRVAVMLHTHLGTDPAAVRETVREPFLRYLTGSTGLARSYLRTIGQEVDDDSLQAAVRRGIERYLDRAGLFGTPESISDMVHQLAELGVDEIACLVDFGLPTSAVLDCIRLLADLPARAAAHRRAPAASGSSLAGVARELRRHRPTHLQCTPTLARALLADPATRAGLGRLRVLLVGGEALPGQLAAALRQVVPEVHNMYGPTETTVWSTSQPAPNLGDAVADIGRPLANTTVHVLDRHGARVPVGVPGELSIGGAGVGRGYLNQPELTERSFRADPFRDDPAAQLYRTGDQARWTNEHRLQFLGRSDQQIKIRGVRVEPAEVQRAIETHPAVRQAVVTSLPDRDRDPRLVAYLIPAEPVGGPDAAGTDRPNAADGARPGLRVSSQADHAFAGLHVTTLPDGLRVAGHGGLQTTSIHEEIFVEHTYLRHGITLRPGDTVIDAGANIGLFTLYVASRCREVRIHAFEPIPDTFQLLEANVAAYGLDVTLHPCGLSDQADEADFVFYPAASGLSGRAERVDEVQRVTRAVARRWAADIHHSLSDADAARLAERYLTATPRRCRVRRLSDVLNEHGVERIDLLKIDVEGSEVEVLRGVADQHWPRIRQVVVEVDGRDRLTEITAILRRHGFSWHAEATIPFGTDAVHTVWARATEREDRPDQAALRDYLADRLPAQMIPEHVVWLTELPQTPHDKVDLKALPAPAAARPTAQALPDDEVARRVADCWTRVLGRDVGPDDDFFDLGGNSLKLVDLFEQLNEEWPDALRLAELFDKVTLRQQFRLIEQRVGGAGTSASTMRSYEL
ncbi:MAG: MupA/Atu3671 family FMN-dependent luciferase-like monooxygenase [Pseudonocardiaceae bacterium]